MCYKCWKGVTNPLTMLLDGLSQCQGYCCLMIGYESLVCMWLTLVFNDWDCYNMWKCIYCMLD